MIAHARPELSVRRLCALLGVGRSRYDACSDGPTRVTPDPALRDAVERIVPEFPGSGDRRATHALRREGWTVNHKRVLRVMRHESLPCRLKRRFGTTTDSGHVLRIDPNLAAGFAPTGSPPKFGWRTSPTSGCRPRSRTSPASSTHGHGAVSAGTGLEPSTPA